MSGTIFALATGAGRAAIAVLRISGPGTAEILRRLAGGLPAPRRASLRRLRHGGAALDRAMVLWFPGPASYTGEDSAELHLHGGPAVVAAVGSALAALGARPAEPGEFTRRAFLNGRLDLTEAEGIADLIAAETEAQRRQALALAEGGLARRIAGWSEAVARLLARQEAFIEFEEEDLPADLDAEVAVAAGALRDDMAAALAEAPRRERLREGVAIAILGPPNAGKSSLLNWLAGREAAIVSTRAGTTRDVVEVRVAISGVPVTLADTAGLRETDDEVEAEGVRRALARAESADLRLLLLPTDASVDARLLDMAGPDALVLASKCDLAGCATHDTAAGTLRISTRTGEGLDRLEARLAEEVARRAGGTDAAGLSRPRHRAALREAVEWLERLPHAGLPELRAETLRGALHALGRITGRVDAESILDRIFGEFCIGK